MGSILLHMWVGLFNRVFEIADGVGRCPIMLGCLPKQFVPTYIVPVRYFIHVSSMSGYHQLMLNIRCWGICYINLYQRIGFTFSVSHTFPAWYGNIRQRYQLSVAAYSCASMIYQHWYRMYVNWVIETHRLCWYTTYTICSSLHVTIGCRYS